jgi:hypothetical protein
MSGEKQFSRKEFLRFLGVGAAGLAIGSPVSWIRGSRSRRLRPRCWAYSCLLDIQSRLRIPP